MSQAVANSGWTPVAPGSPVACSRLRNLQAVEHGVAAKHHLKLRHGPERLLQNNDGNLESVPGDLYDLAKRVPCQTDRRRQSYNPFFPNDTRFDSSSIRCHDDEGKQPSVREIYILCPFIWLVERIVTLQDKVLQMRPDGKILLVRK
jgi:hypothetical protein